MLVEVIMHNRIVHEVAIPVAMLIHGDSISRLAAAVLAVAAAEVGHQADHGQHRAQAMGMMMEEVSNKILIEPSSTRQSQIIMHESLAGNLAK